MNSILQSFGKLLVLLYKNNDSVLNEFALVELLYR